MTHAPGKRSALTVSLFCFSNSLIEFIKDLCRAILFKLIPKDYARIDFQVNDPEDNDDRLSNDKRRFKSTKNIKKNKSCFITKFSKNVLVVKDYY